jgi:hypothetical protein
MKYEILYRDLLAQLQKRTPQNSKLVAKLADILNLEKESIYRRLRREVPFTFEEIMVIAKKFSISLDSMLGVDAKPTYPFRFQSVENENPVEVDYVMLDGFVQAIKDVASDPDGEMSLVTNLLPLSLYMGFQRIYHFYYFKWRYYSAPASQTKSYHEILFPDRLVQIIKDIFVHSKKVQTTHFIVDSRIFHNFVNDVTYFNSIRLINDNDVLLVKDNLLHFVDYIEAIAAKGYIDNPSNKVFIYLSETGIDTSYSYVYSRHSIRFVLLWSFIFNGVLTFDEEILAIMRLRIRSIIRTSALLSVTGEKQRILYFDTQRKIVEQLGKSY